MLILGIKIFSTQGLLLVCETNLKLFQSYWNKRPNKDRTLRCQGLTLHKENQHAVCEKTDNLQLTFEEYKQELHFSRYLSKE